MNLFLAGATGVIGRNLLPMLAEAGFTVTAMTRTEAGAAQIAGQGATPVVCDVFDTDRVMEVVAAAEPEVVVHQLTSIPANINPRHISRDMAATNRLRTDGTEILVAAAEAAGARRFLAQSIAFAYTPNGTGPAGEDDYLYDDGPKEIVAIVDAVRACERLTLGTPGLEGTVLRYGFLYGPGTPYARDGAFTRGVAGRHIPIVGDGAGVFSFVHVADAAAATVAALKNGATGIFNIVDDEPAPVRDWLPFLAELIGAPAPHSVPQFLGRLAGGDYTIYLMNQQRGASNRKAREDLGWQPTYPSWRDGFRAELGA